jgi:hypothetical protein
MQHDVQTPIHPGGGPPSLGFASLRGGFAALPGGGPPSLGFASLRGGFALGFASLRGGFAALPGWLRCAPVAVAAATPRSRALPAALRRGEASPCGQAGFARRYPAGLDAWTAALHLGSNS